MNDQISAADDLIVEYQLNVALWQHDDTLRQQRHGTFLTVNTVLLVAIGALTALKAPLLYLGATGIVFGVFGAIVCRIWHVVQVRSAEYIRFRRFQLRSIEAQLSNLTTFKNTYTAFYDGKPVQFSDIDETFQIEPRAQKRSTMSEGVLPLVVGIFWAVIAVVSAILLLTKLVASYPP